MTPISGEPFQPKNYIFISRPNAAQLLNFAIVENVKGCIILPDDFVLPEGAKFVPYNPENIFLAKDYYIVQSKKRDDPTFNVYSDCTYTKEEFKKLEAAGAVFFPLVGVYPFMKENEEGKYWTSSGEGKESPYLYIGTNQIWPKHNAIMRDYRMALRLVRDVKK